MQGTKRWFVVLSLLLVLARLAGPVRAQSCEWARGFELAGIDGYVYALTGFADSNGPALYAGGSFTAAGGVVANRIAKWDGQQWSALGSGMGMNDYVYALTGFADGSGPALYAGGAFTTAGGVGVNSIAKWRCARPPVCDTARANPDVLWPPNHKLVSVAVVGVIDPNNNQITLTVTGVTQDEPVNGLGNGDMSPDAVLQGDKVRLRAERAGTGNGRVYQVSFTADNGLGGRCTGIVTVCVPHDQGHSPCIDDGQRYDSTQP